MSLELCTSFVRILGQIDCFHRFRLAPCKMLSICALATKQVSAPSKKEIKKNPRKVIQTWKILSNFELV